MFIKDYRCDVDLTRVVGENGSLAMLMFDKNLSTAAVAKEFGITSDELKTRLYNTPLTYEERTEFIEKVEAASDKQSNVEWILANSFK